MRKREPVQENETNEIISDFEIQTDYLMSARRTDLVIKYKRTCRIVNLAVSADHRVKIKENENRDHIQMLPENM